MKHLSKKNIERKFTIIAENNKFAMLEHNDFGEDWIIVVNKENNTYCNTDDSFTYTSSYPEDYEWYSIRE